MEGTTWELSGYTHVRELGKGASGRVLLATHDRTGTPVAIKYLVPRFGDATAFTEAFRAEALLLAEIDDPFVAKLYEYVESASGAAIVMELVNGVSLRQMLRAHGATDPAAALCVLKGSLLGLAAAHDRDVVHRDYKPENVLVTADGESKLADFGIALPSGVPTGVQVTGTPRYMAPEQWKGGPASPAGDIYAATATFYECLTGRPPYEGPDLVALWHQHAYAPIPTPEAPEPVVELVRRGLAKDPAERPWSARAFVDELAEAAGLAYGTDWEDRGWPELARRAALLAALFPFADRVGGATAVANTVLGTAAGAGAGADTGTGPANGAAGRRWARKAALVGGLAVVLSSGGIGLSYAARDTPAAVADPAPRPSAVTALTPAGVPTPGATPAAGPPATPTATPTATATTPGPPGPPDPVGGGPSTVRTPGRGPTSTTSSLPLPPPPADVVAPTVGRVAASPTAIDPAGCPYAPTSSVVTAIASDDRTPPERLRVSFQYTMLGQSATVAMSHQGGGRFGGVLGPLTPPPGNEQRIPVTISVAATDAAGNRSAAAGPVSVVVHGYCTPG
ncbi:serine/threonine-protein kinase [Plantactinospora sp. GCM10030261]|uniref:serine/threonine-protein kinase n=1 Tax=Plantactinospora sp. GCM10030261 TaxID=3273420 RepID=UPI003612A385